MVFRVMSVHCGSPVSMDTARIILATPITLGHVTAHSPRFCGRGELRSPPIGNVHEPLFATLYVFDIMSEQIIEGLRIHIDRDLCVSFGDCIEAAPGVFEFDDEDIAVFVAEPGAITREELIEACASCPVDALTAFDEEGRQLAP